MARTFQFDEFNAQQHPNCAACEEFLTDAIDGALSPADQQFVDGHIAVCLACLEKLVEARRGAAWLDLLKTQRPEPSAGLLERIMAQTSGASSFQASQDEALLSSVSAGVSTNVIPFAPRPVSRFTRFTRLAMEPRFAMTAAMAFFSIALTLNLTGVRLDQLRASDLRPASLKRTYYQANASAVRYYDNLRLVHVLESRVEDIRQSQADSQHAPAARPKTPDEQKKQGVPPGSSRRESPLAEPAPLQSRLIGDSNMLPLNSRSAQASGISLRIKTEGALA